MARKLTSRQLEILAFIVQYIDDNAYPPTFREIGLAISINSTKAVNDHLAVLERKGYIAREKGKSRAIQILELPEELRSGSGATTARVLSVQSPVRIIEGAAIAANPAGTTAFEDYVHSALPIDSTMFGGGECFALRVDGDSMEGAHICDGDLAIFARNKPVSNGDIAAIQLEDEVTLKIFNKDGSKVTLISANRAYPPKSVDTNEVPVRILGRFVGIIRTER